MNSIQLIISQLPRQSEEENSASRIAKQELLGAIQREISTTNSKEANTGACKPNCVTDI